MGAPSQMPVTGSGNYSGSAAGTAALAGLGYSLKGTSHFTVNFASFNFTGGMDLTGTTLNSAVSAPSLSISLSIGDGKLTRGVPVWSGNLLSGSSKVGAIDGHFFGPARIVRSGFQPERHYGHLAAKK